MKDIEGLLRAAYNHAARSMAPEDLRPAPRPSSPPSRPRSQRRRHRMAYPVLAAVAVLLVASAAALIPHLLPRASGRVPANGPGRGLRHGAPPGPAPTFFAALSGTGLSIKFLSTTTGQVTGQVPPPGVNDHFGGVAAEPDNRTFVVAVETDSGGGCAAHLYQVRLDDAGRPGRLRPMAQPPLQGILPNRVMALSPDGSKLAYFGYCQGSGNLVVTDLATGSSSTWTGQPGEDPQNVSLSADGAVISVSGWEFRGYAPGPVSGTWAVRLRPVTSILRATDQFATLDSGAVVLNESTQAALSPDGTMLYTCGIQGRRDVLSDYGVATRKQLAVLASWPRATGSCAMAMAPSGGYLLLGDVRGHAAIFSTATGGVTRTSAAGLGGGYVIAW